MYQYEERELNGPIAEELIRELFAGQKNVKKAEIKSRVLREHSNRGGKPYTRQTTPVTKALKNLRDNKGLATNQRRGYWTFKANEASVKTNEASVDELQGFNEIRAVYEKKIIAGLVGSAGRLQTRSDSRRLKKIAEDVNTCHERLQKLIAACEIIEEVERATKPQHPSDSQ